MNEIMEREAEIVNQNEQQEKYIETCTLHEGIRVLFDIKKVSSCPLCYKSRMLDESLHVIEQMKAKIVGYDRLLEKLESRIKP